jgi:thymidine kinase
MFEALIATGRTTRLIEEAKRLQQQGKRVVVVVATSHQVNEIRIKTGDTIPVVHSQSSEWDWNEMRQHGLPLETEYLIDHYAIEKKYAKILQALHRFDPPVIKVG